MARAQIIGTGLYAPPRVVTNAYFNEYYGEDVDSFLRTQRNIRERRYAEDGQTTSDLVVEAARAALAEAGMTPQDLALIIVATDTPDYLSPATATVVQHKLGARRAGTFDVNAACAGFVTALEVGRRFVEGGSGPVLVAGGYLMSRFLDFSQRNIATLFADGAGAVVLAPADDEEPGILLTRLEAEGQYYDYMGIYTGGACCPHEPQVLAFRKKFPKTYNVEHWTRLVRWLSKELGVQPEAVDHLFFTQINVLSIRETLAALGLPESRTHYVMDRYGYTGSACIPMVLADAVRAHRLRRGDLVYLIASGGGAALAAMALRWAYDT
ncbi:3-oxoacyl-ACP synthase III family protein [Rhodothermus marinus]|uniref:3-oxoacyl-ACP synthase III family protein n=1 Tax=Rhodothermus marinus TaxID=29549 RepID=UPI001DE5A4DB|nr:ketoacyl-ACP synthase III [Rhodothermus marinus]MBO2492422.1 ketoacyl-ACP synthase III [Rhodothermus marinus]